MGTTNRARGKVLGKAAGWLLVETVVILHETMRQSGPANAHYETVSVRRPTIPYSRTGCWLAAGLHRLSTYY